MTWIQELRTRVARCVDPNYLPDSALARWVESGVEDPRFSWEHERELIAFILKDHG
jgi:hypothetical protein